MASDKEQLDFVLDQIGGAGAVTAKKMFGEYGIYCDGKITALLCDNRLFIKPTTAGHAYIGTAVEAPPYPGAKSYFLIEDRIDDREWLTALVRVTARELPMPVKKAKKAAKKSSKKR